MGVPALPMPTCEPSAREVLLEGQVAALTADLQLLKEEIERLQQEKHVLRLKIDALSRRLFGRSSEKLNPGQLQLVFDTLAQEAAAAWATQLQRNPLPENPVLTLPRPPRLRLRHRLGESAAWPSSSKTFPRPPPS
jgi:hypothetical protein